MKKEKTYLCPACKKRKPESHFLCVLASKAGSSGTGKKKARTREQAQAAAMARWSKSRAEVQD